MPYISAKERKARAQRLRDKLPDLLGMKPHPLPEEEDIDTYRSLHCPSYDNCIHVAAQAGWKNMTCVGCPIDAMYGKEFLTYGRRQDLERIATTRLGDDGIQRDAPGSFGLPKTARLSSKPLKPQGLGSVVFGLFILALTNCATVQPTLPTVLPGQKRVEDTPLPQDPATEKLPDGTPRGEWVLPLEKGSCLKADGTPKEKAPQPCPSLSGISLSEEKAARLTLFKIRYPELRLNYKADRQVWKVHRELYETRLKLADQAIQKLQPGWFQRHKFELGIIAGFITGVGVSFGAVSLAGGL